MNAEVLDITILGPAFLAGLAVLVTHVPLGHEVLRRGIIFLDLAVAQIAGLGVIAANVFLGDASAWLVQLSALVFALGGAQLLSTSERHWPEVQEAIIGSAFVIAASFGLLLLAQDPHGGERLKDLLAGQLLWVGWDEIAVGFVVAIAVTSLWVFFVSRHSRIRVTVFYLLFAVAITTSVQIVGIYLVFASLIIPALAVQRMHERAMTWAYGIGISGYAIGLILSGLLDLPAGPLIVLCLAVSAVLVRIKTGRSGYTRPEQHPRKTTSSKSHE